MLGTRVRVKEVFDEPPSPTIRSPPEASPGFAKPDLLAAVYSRLLADEIRIFPVHLHHSVVRDHIGRDF